MAPFLQDDEGLVHEPLSKKPRLSDDDSSSQAPESKNETSDASRVQRHPLKVKPLGNLYTASQANIKHHAGLLARLPDELVLDLLGHLEAKDLLLLGATCRALHAFCRHDELWRAMFVEASPSSFRWLGTWRNTFCGDRMDAVVDCSGLYSDALFRPYFCACASLEPYVREIPARNEIARLPDLTHDEFTNGGWANKPFILTDPVKSWPVYRDWSKDKLLKEHAKTAFRAEAVDWPLDKYVEYMDNSVDESPLYLFDCRFAEKMGLHPGDRPVPDGAEADYTPPAAFGSDLFNVLGTARPNDRWLIVGPARSGSTFHKDPNGTSAWNAVIRGSKYWLMFPALLSKIDSRTGVSKTEALPPPPGVFLSPDGSEVTSPLSIAEYLHSFHEIARKTPHCIEGICHEGEILHVPSGWFHLVLNLEESIALTQNFIAEAHLRDVLLFLRDSPDQISGFSRDTDTTTVYERFMDRLGEAYPDVAAKARRELAEYDQQKHQPAAKSKWEELTTESSTGFSFGFGDSSDVE